MNKALKIHLLRLISFILLAALPPAISSANFCGQHFNPSLSGPLETRKALSQALMDPIVEQGRTFKLYDDFKVLADLSPRNLSPEKIAQIQDQYQKMPDKKKATQFYIESRYEHKNELLPSRNPEVKPTWTIRNSPHKATFDHTEKMWEVLTRRTPKETKSSLIPLPEDLLIPGARFQEGYYWDTMFAFPALLKTGRINLVRGQINNFLHQLRTNGFIRNGNRDYYTRSQPPLISQMVKIYLKHLMMQGPLSKETLRWVAEEAYPLIKRDYEYFWMNKNTRYREETGLNNFFDSQNTPRPERHSSDNESEIGVTYRDVRAEAEDGKDFTDAHEGEITKYDTVLLNSLLYQVENNLSWMAQLVGQNHESKQFDAAAEKRKFLVNKYLWDPERKTFMDYNTRKKQFSPVMTADIFLPLYVGLASPEQAQAVVRQLPALERKGGLMSSDHNSGKQWDAPYGWAPHHYFAINGMIDYGYKADAHRLAWKWVQTIDRIYQETGKIIEKIDAERGGVPVETGDKYPTQDGFLWTNGVYIWALTDILGYKLEPLQRK